MYCRQFTLVASVCVLPFSVVLSSPTPVSPPRAVHIRQESTLPDSTACGDVINYVDQGFAYLYASDAYACLQSVPFNAAVATRFIEYVNTTLQFQSTLAYLKNPPTGYQQPPVDVLGGLQRIKTNVTSGVYKNQYDFETDLQYLFYQTHDAHVYLTAGISAAFTFLAPYSITAASLDGKDLPKVYVTSHIIDARNEARKPSAIKTINGEDAVTYLRKLASINSFGGREAHTDWNQLFDMPALAPNGAHSIWEGNIKFYPGDEINGDEIILKLENGTEYRDYWYALYNEPYATGPLVTGGDFYNYFVLGLLPASFNDGTDGFLNKAYNGTTDDANSTNTTEPVKHSWADLTYGAYPDPDVAQDGLGLLEDGIVSGYYLRDIDAAVLSIPSFGQTGYAIANFSAAISYFIANVTQANLTRVVIDLQQNKGGTVELAFSIFKRFFPNQDPYTASRRRSHPLGNILGQEKTRYFDTISAADQGYDDYLASEWVITSRLNAATGRNFTSWTEYRGPVQANGDSFSLVERYNLSSYDFDAALFEGWIPRGYTAQEPFPDDYEQPFAAKDIVVLTDGICSSACALLVEMFTQVGVKTIVAGGLPITGPMQAIGGTRGAATYSSYSLDSDLSSLSLSGTSPDILAATPVLLNSGTRDSGVFTTVLAVNLRDQMRANEATPLQFKYDAADCRIFYTLDNVYNMSRLWRDATTAAFDDRSRCVEGSTGFANSSKPAPQISIVKAAPQLNLGASDGLVTEEGLDLSGGLQDWRFSPGATDITPCHATGCAQQQTCETVTLSGCNNPTVKGDYQLCVPYISDSATCPDGLTYEPRVIKTIKGFKDPSRPSSTLNLGTKSFGLGSCIPIKNSPKYCIK